MGTATTPTTAVSSAAQTPTTMAPGPLVTTAPFHCEVHSKTWERAVWSTEKKEYCCKRHHIRCAEPAPKLEQDRFNCTSLEAWSPVKTQWCCRHEHLPVGCVVVGKTLST